MTLRGGLAGRVARLEGLDAGACSVCRGNPICMAWATGPGQPPPRDVGEHAPAAPTTCAGCGRPMTRYILRWQTDADTEASR